MPVLNSKTRICRTELAATNSDGIKGFVKRYIGMTLLALAGIAGSGGGPGAQPVLGTEPGAEVTADGLYPVHPSIMPAAWVKPDTDLSRYTRIFFLPTIVQYREATDRRYEQRKLENRIPC